jgi:hypothetical protein
MEATMGVRLVNDVRAVALRVGGRSLTARVRVRGIDAREFADQAPYFPMVPSGTGWSGARSVLIEQLEPLDVAVETGGAVQRLQFKSGEPPALALAWIGIPVAALLARSLMRRRT